MLHSTYLSSLLLCGSLISANPLAKRATQPSNAEIWVPDGNGNLKPADFSAVNFPDGIPGPGDTVFEADHCDDNEQSVKDKFANWRLYWCNIRTQVVYGQPVKISPDVNCAATQTCAITHTDTVAIAEAFQVSGGTDFAGDIAKIIKATAKLAAAKTWTTTTTKTDSIAFTPKQGSKGHMVFFPYYFQACGPHFSIKEAFDGTKPPFSYHAYDPMVCGLSPLTLSDGKPDGIYSFCNTETGQGCGP
ncbi:hypothetical protein F4779DRAFT_595085 [Xylariaceae sp. FL0662B]|nr:hypothetical protein F4779DRAFT_595085 [Xylariaceae sp. FL0662B]